MASNLTFGKQLVSPGIVIPLTADAASGSDLKPVKVDVSISDKVINTIGTTMKTVTLNYNASSSKYEGNLTLEYGEIPGSNYQSDFAIGGVIRGGANTTFVEYNIEPYVYYMAQVKDVKIDSIVPGNGSITIYSSHDGIVDNSLNKLMDLSNVYIRLCKLDAKTHKIGYSVGTLVTDPVTYSDTRKHYMLVVNGLINEVEYEIGITMVNQVGPTAASTSAVGKPSLYPNAFTFNSFNSLDVSGGRFKVSLDNQDDTLSTFKTLQMKVTYTSTQVNLPSTVQTIDLSGSYPNSGNATKRAVEFLMPPAFRTALLAGSAFNKFTVNAFLQADISGTDLSGAQIKTLAGVMVSKEYIMDRPLTVSSFTLDAVDWTTGIQTLKASILGGRTDISYNGVVATFDISGSLANSTIQPIDICNNVTNMRLAINYSDLQSAKLSVKPTVVMSRHELNVPNDPVPANPTLNTSAKVELAHVLSVLKRGDAPVLQFTPLPTEATKLATFKFLAATKTNVTNDLSANTYYRIQLDELGATKVSTIQDKTTKSVSQMTDASGETFTLTSSTIAAGIKCVLRAFTILDLSKYASAYTALNKNERYLPSAETNQSEVFKGIPDVFVSLRPSAETQGDLANKLNTIRVSGNLKANKIDNIYVFGQDVCGRILFRAIDILPSTRDICGRMMSADAVGPASNDFAGVFAYDIPFDANDLSFNGVVTPFSANPVQLFAVLDTTDDVDKVVTRNTTSTVETDFVAKVAAISSVQTAYTVALDVSNSPGGVIVDGKLVGGDVQYKIIDASSSAVGTAITDLSKNIDTSYSTFNALPTKRDDAVTVIGSKKHFDKKTADLNKAKKETTDVHTYNLDLITARYTTIVTSSNETFIILNWRDPSTNSVGYTTSVKAFEDPSFNGMVNNEQKSQWGQSSTYPEYHNNEYPGFYSTHRAFRKALGDANVALAAAQNREELARIDELNSRVQHTDVLSQIANFSASVKVMEDRLVALKAEQVKLTADKQARATVLVAAAATAKLAVDSATSDLAKARLVFFDASNNPLG